MNRLLFYCKISFWRRLNGRCFGEINGFIEYGNLATNIRQSCVWASVVVWDPVLVIIFNFFSFIMTAGLSVVRNICTVYSL